MMRRIETYGDINFAPPLGFSKVDVSSDRFNAAMQDIFWGSDPLLCVMGAGGCGKSVLLKMAAFKFGPRCLCVAPTGMAAQNINTNVGANGKITAKTIHSALGIPIAESDNIIKDSEKNRRGNLAKKKMPINTKGQAKGGDFYSLFVKETQKIERTRTLIVPDKAEFLYSPETSQRIVKLLEHVDLVLLDEVSMVSGNLFDYIMLQITNAGRKKGKLIRLVCFGDPLQLPPVVLDKRMDGRTPENLEETQKMFFESRFWKALKPKVHVLNAIYRQKDGAFKEVLNNIRKGIITDKEKEFVRQHLSPCDSKSLTIAPTNALVNLYNQREEEKLLKTNPRKFVFPYIVVSAHEEGSTIRFPENFPGDITLYEGERIMCTKNASDGSYRNGTTGILLGCKWETRIIWRKIFNGGGRSQAVRCTVPMAIVKKDDNGQIIKVRAHEYGNEQTSDARELKLFQVPIVKAYAVTYHKSQGLTLSGLGMDTKALRGDGMFYLGLSRVKSADNLRITAEPDWDKVAPNPKAIAFVEECEAKAQEVCDNTIIKQASV
jgi:ATP-dependent exoDNAse (exonuclease V) alpha subunit